MAECWRAQTRIFLRPRVWVGVPAVLVGVAVGYFTNLVTGADVTWPVVVGFGTAVAVWVALTVVTAGRAERGRLAAARRSRAAVLSPLSASALSADERHTLASLLSPAYALSPFRARGQEHHAFVGWCVDQAASRVHLLGGASGVGKTRLMVEVGAALPDGWVAGRVNVGAAPIVLDAVVTAAEPTLIVLDDADTVARQAAELVRRISTEEPFDPPVKLVLVVRDAEAFGRLLGELVPSELTVSRPSVTLKAVGGEGDRRRWFAEAVCAYSAALCASVPPVSELDERPVGVAGEPMVATQVRAALAALDGTVAGAARLRSAPLGVLVDEIVHHERRRWRSIIEDSSLGLPASFTPQACQDAVLSLILLAPATVPDAAAALRACPRCRDYDEGQVRNIVNAVHRLYPGDPALPVTPTPDFLLGALLARAAQAADKDDIDVSGLAQVAAQRPYLAGRLLRSTPMFPSILSLVVTALDLDGDKLVLAAEALVLTGPASRAVEHVLVAAIRRSDLTKAHAERLLRLIGAHGWGHVQAELRRVLVAHARMAATADPGPATADLATALRNLGLTLRVVGEWREALTACRESVALWRALVAAEPAAHTQGLAKALINLGLSLRDVGEQREALTVERESVALWRTLAAAEPAAHTPDLAGMLYNLGPSLLVVGEWREALAVCQESVALWRGLAGAEPAAHTPDLAKALDNLGMVLWEVGECREALSVFRESVALRRELVAAEPAVHTAELATALNGLGASLSKVGEKREALAVFRESVALRRELVAAEPAAHTADLAMSLINLGVGLSEMGEPQKALAVKRESVALWRALVAAEPAVHTADLATALANLGTVLREVGEWGEALTVTQEAVALRRELAAAEPAAHAAYLAGELRNLGACLWDVGERHEALAVTKEAVALRRELAAAEPAANTTDLAAALSNLASAVCNAGDHDEELKLRAEGVAWLARLAHQNPDEADDRYRRARREFAQQCSQHDREPSFALRAEQEALHELPEDVAAADTS